MVGGEEPLEVRSASEPLLLPLRRARRWALPAQPSLLVGREDDCFHAVDLVVNEGARLLTLIGPAGVGKTRLALAIAERVEAQFAHGAAFIDFAPLRDAGAVLDTIAQALGLRPQGVLTPAEQLDAYLEDMSLLLVLDNFEHLLNASAQVARLLERARHVTIITTSRAALRVRWERVYEVAPLPPDASLAMFVDCARGVRSDFVCRESDLPILTEICARLDGLPLAIELAAARTTILSPAEILERLSHRLVLLTDAPRDASARHRTLREAIAWSYELLSSDQRALLRRVSAFVGGFTLDAASGVAGTAEAASLDVLTGLLRMSLVRVEAVSADQPESRFRLLETVREFAREQAVSADELDAADLAHAEYWCSYVERHYPLNFGPEVVGYHLRLSREHPNLRQALSWSIENGHVDLALRTGAGLHWFWYGRGDLAEGIGYLTAAWQRASAAGEPSRCVAARALGALVLNQGHLNEALEWLDVAVRLGRSRPPEPNSQAELAMALGIRGVTQIAAGRYSDAESSIRASLGIFQSIRDQWGIATAREVLGAIAALQGNADLGESLASEALEVHRQLGGRENIARSLDVLGYAFTLRGELSRAEACFEESLSLRRSIPNRPASAAVLARLGLVAYLAKQWVRASVYYRESLALAQEVGDAAGVVRCLGQIAALALACNLDRATVARLGVAVRQHQSALALPSPPVEQIAARRLEAALRASLSSVRLAAAWVSGRVMNLDDAVRLGFGLLDQVGAPSPGAEGAESDPLTRREQQVAALVAQGLTNRQIAEELVIAQRTVDTHVERILSKLGFSSRAQIAVWVATQGSPSLKG